jgi:5-methylcytosine-specific restriction endonuclease McrA
MGRRTFCSGEQASFDYRSGEASKPGHGCVHEFMLGSNPGYVRKLVWARDKGVCAFCGDIAPGKAGAYWQADHTTPVAEGGGLCGLEGYRTLCTPCHKRETAALAKRRAGRHKVQHG